MNYGDIVHVRIATGRILHKRVVIVITNQVFVCSEAEWQNAIKENRRPYSIPYHVDDVLEAAGHQEEREGGNSDRDQ